MLLLLPLFERLNLGLLVDQPALDALHVIVGLDHLCEKVVGSGRRDVLLQQLFVRLCDGISDSSEEGELPLEVVLHIGNFHRSQSVQHQLLSPWPVVLQLLQHGHDHLA